jgi:hypothetical protein
MRTGDHHEYDDDGTVESHDLSPLRMACVLASITTLWRSFRRQ